MTDWGVPFDPLDHDDPTKPTSVEDARIGGLGIMMVKRMTDDLSYVRDDDANVVAFKKSW
jgi:serine/threonine-protein kinase RsbW